MKKKNGKCVICSEKRGYPGLGMIIYPYCLLILSSIFFTVFSTGCKKDAQDNTKKSDVAEVDPAVTNRNLDVKYQAALISAATNQTVKVGARNVVLMKMKQIEGEIRKAMPTNATPEQLQAAYSQNKEWNKFNAERLRMNDEIREMTINAKEMIANRLRSEEKAREELRKAQKSK